MALFRGDGPALIEKTDELFVRQNSLLSHDLRTDGSFFCPDGKGKVAMERLYR